MGPVQILAYFQAFALVYASSSVITFIDAISAEQSNPSIATWSPESKSCFQSALDILPATLKDPCELVSSSDELRVSLAARMALCEISTTEISSSRVWVSTSIPSECENWKKGKQKYTVGGCVNALSKSPQYWSSYSQNLREVVVLCSAYRRWDDIESAKNLYSSSSQQMSSFMHKIAELERLKGQRDTDVDKKLTASFNALQDLLDALFDQTKTLASYSRGFNDSLIAFHMSSKSELQTMARNLLSSSQQVYESSAAALYSQQNELLKSLVDQASQQLGTNVELVSTKLSAYQHEAFLAWKTRMAEENTRLGFIEAQLNSLQYQQSAQLNKLSTQYSKHEAIFQDAVANMTETLLNATTIFFPVSSIFNKWHLKLVEVKNRVPLSLEKSESLLNQFLLFVAKKVIGGGSISRVIWIILGLQTMHPLRVMRYVLGSFVWLKSPRIAQARLTRPSNAQSYLF